MREYEIVVIVQPDLDDTAFAEVVGRVSGWVKDSGGEVAFDFGVAGRHHRAWGLRWDSSAAGVGGFQVRLEMGWVVAVNESMTMKLLRLHYQVGYPKQPWRIEYWRGDDRFRASLHFHWNCLGRTHWLCVFLPW